jgi:TetR/AcrR family transcriptional regulator
MKSLAAGATVTTKASEGAARKSAPKPRARAQADAGAGAKSAPASPAESDDAGPPTRKAKLERTREAILDNALILYSLHGYEGASTRDIASRAGVSHGMIRHIFGSNEELWRVAVAFMFRRAHAEIWVDPKGLTPTQEFEAMIRRYIRYCARHPEHTRIMVQLSSVSGPTLYPETQHFIATRRQGLYANIEALKREGLMPDVDTSSILMSVVSACQMIFVLGPEIKEALHRDMTLPEEIEKHTEAVLALFLRRHPEKTPGSGGSP